jgi:hypothetical protein
LGFGDWGLGIGDWAQSPIPNPQSPIPNPHLILLFSKILKKIIIINYNLINMSDIIFYLLKFNVC